MAHGWLKKGGPVLIASCVLALAGCGQAKPVKPLSAHSIKPDKPVSILIPSWQNQFSPINSWQSVGKAIEADLEKDGMPEQSLSIDAVDSQGEAEALGKAKKGDIVVALPAEKAGAVRQEFGNLLSPSPDPSLSRALSSTRAAFVTTLPGAAVSVPLPSMYDVGRLEASSLLEKIKNYRLTSVTPFPVLILIPFDPSSPSSLQDGHELFEGMWSELSPYFEKRLVWDPAWDGQNWQDLLIDASSKASIEAAFKKVVSQAREKENVALSPLKTPPSRSLLPNIGAILASNDFVASQVGGVLKDLGYQGTVADADTSLSQGSSQESVAKEEPPAPAEDMGEKAKEEVAKALVKERKAQSWPILIGFGALSSSLSSVVNAREWSTGMVDRSSFASAVAASCMKEESGEKPFPKAVGAVAVDENNFKRILIETGLVSPTQAGL
ncbi:MAG: hypothetical protein IKS61_01450 [Aeriscardovia sp.]|nr:hypothetical protein [Aeriscardovia sp.]